MKIRIEHETTAMLPEYGDVSIAFTVDSKFNVESIDGEPSSWKLSEVKIDAPYLKDYDVHEPPTRWLGRDTSNWRVISAYSGDLRVGGAVVAWKNPELYFLEGRDDLAALWDLRVAPEWRGQGVGSTLFRHAVDYAESKRCSQLKIEIQDTNIRACKFYARQGCKLTEVNRHAYSDFPEETQLVWTLDLSTSFRG